MSVVDTSIDVYETLIKPNLSDLQIKVYEIYSSKELASIEENNFDSVTLSLTNGEVAHIMGKKPNETSGRVLELRKIGLLRLKERRKCRADNNTAWAVELWK